LFLWIRSSRLCTSYLLQPQWQARSGRVVGQCSSIEGSLSCISTWQRVFAVPWRTTKASRHDKAQLRTAKPWCARQRIYARQRGQLLPMHGRPANPILSSQSSHSRSSRSRSSRSLPTPRRRCLPAKPPPPRPPTSPLPLATSPAHLAPAPRQPCPYPANPAPARPALPLPGLPRVASLPRRAAPARPSSASSGRRPAGKVMCECSV
jgi:hypothetical protein